MGPLSSNEAKMVGGLGITVVLWIFGAQLGVSAALAAMIGLSILICLGVLTWVGRTVTIVRHPPNANVPTRT